MCDFYKVLQSGLNQGILWGMYLEKLKSNIQRTACNLDSNLPTDAQQDLHGQGQKCNAMQSIDLFFLLS